MDPEHKKLTELYNAGYETKTVEYKGITWQWKSEFTKHPAGKKVTLSHHQPLYIKTITLSGPYGSWYNKETNTKIGSLGIIFNQNAIQPVTYKGKKWQRTQELVQKYNKGYPLITKRVKLVHNGTFKKLTIELESLEMYYDPGTTVIPSFTQKSESIATAAQALAALGKAATFNKIKKAK